MSAPDVARASPSVVKTACNRDCPDACSILVTVEEGRATRLAGDPDDPITRGFLCERTSKFLTRQYADDRFVQPMVRANGRLVPIGWDEALDLAAEKLKAIRAESGPAAILHYHSGGSLGLLKNAADYLFEQFGPVTIKRGDICSGAGDEANLRDFGLPEQSDWFDPLHAHLIVVWGKNVHTSGPHLLPVLNEAKRRGARFVGIDPVRTRSAALCELFLQPRPGTDAAIAFAVARHLFESGATDPQAASYCHGLDAYRELAFARTMAERAAEAGVPLADLRRFAELYASLKPATIFVGWGLARRGNGCATVRAIDGLALVSGNVGVRGGGAAYTATRRHAFDLTFLRGVAGAPRTFAEPTLGPEMLAAKDPPIRATWVTAGNPVSMLPESETVRRAFERSEFNVVVDTHPTDTTDLAHLVLPCPTLIEDDDLLGSYGHHWLRVSRPAIEPPPQVRHEIAILHGLAERLGLADRFPASVDAWKRKLLKKVAPHGITPESLERAPARNPFLPEVRFEGRRFATPDGKARLLEELPVPPAPRDAQFPLRLFAGSDPKGQSSQWCEPIEPGPPDVRVHPTAAGAIADGAIAEIESRIGRLRVRVRHDPRLHPELACMAKGGMLRDGRCANVLVRAALSDAGEGAAYYDEPVRLVAAR